MSNCSPKFPNRRTGVGQATTDGRQRTLPSWTIRDLQSRGELPQGDQGETTKRTELLKS